MGDQDGEEKARRKALTEFVLVPSSDTDASLNRFGIHRKLTRIFDGLKTLSEQHDLVMFLKNADNADALNGFVQSLADAIADYQVCCVNPITRTP